MVVVEFHAATGEGSASACATRGPSTRPGVRLTGWLHKEGAGPLSSAFPSRRYCVLLKSKLEYYEERHISVLARQGQLGVNLNDWNLVVLVKPGSAAAASQLEVGDVVVGLDGTALEGRQLKDMVGPLRQDAPYQLQVLRRKGEIPLAGAAVAKIGKRHAGAAFELTPSPREMVDTSRGAFVLIAADAPTCDRWCDALSDTLRSLAETVAADGVPSGGDRQLALIETEEINPTEEVR